MPPGLVVEVPLHGLAEAAFEIFLRFPVEFSLDLAGVDRVAEVVAGAVGDEGDEGGVALFPLTLALSPRGGEGSVLLCPLTLGRPS